MKPIRACFTILRRRSPGYFWYLLSGWLFPRLLFRWRKGFPGKIAQRFSFPVPNSVLRQRARTSTPASPDAAKFTSWARFPVDPKVRAAVESARGNNRHEAFLIGRIDDDGRLLGLFGELPGFPSVSQEGFVGRKRFELGVVLWDDALLIRKDYRGDSETFIREWAVLVMLAGKVNVPAVYHADERRMVLYKNLVWGKTIREILASNGAKILHEHTRNDPELAGLDHQTRIKRVWRRGRDLLPKVFSEQLLTRVAEQLERAHLAGVTGISFTWGNVVIDETAKTPWFIDLDKARVLQSRESAAMQRLRDLEREQFNELYGTALLTEAAARAALAEQCRKTPGWYAPIDFGRGLSVGSFWITDSGTGRWECVNGPVLNHLLPGKRVLDLGSNNGIMPVMMLRAGAKEVLGVEFSPDYADCAQLVRRIFEWRDERRYELRMHLGNMLDVLSCDWGRFDIVTAFCSLYYLEPAEMAAVVRKVAELAPMMVLQAKTDTREEAAENKAEKSSLPFLKTLLEKNGFPHVEVFAPKGFTRPLLVATAAPNGWSVKTMASTAVDLVQKRAFPRVAKAPVKSSFLVATSWQDSPVSQQFRALGAELVSRGHRVTLLIDRHNREGEDHTGNPAVFTWPSIRPTHFQDARFLSRIIRQRRPDCLLSNFGAVNLMTLIGWCHGVKHRIVWHHTLSSQIDTDTLHPPWKLAMLRWRKRHVLRLATAIAAVSGAAREDLRTRFRIPEAKCHVINNSLEDPLRGKAAAKTLSGENRILCVARFHHSKGQDVLLHALALLKPELPQMRVEFLGEGPLRARCERLAGELGLAGCCHFAGAVSHERVLDAMARSDVTVVPSRNEAFGLVALESLAMGTPVVASAVGGLTEILGDGLGTLLMPPDDAEALAKKLKGLLTNGADYLQLSARVRARFVQEFEQSAAVKRQADWLESLVT